jgi:hypothetical protein
VENKLAVALFGLAQQASKFVEIALFLTAAAPSEIIGRLSL